MNTKMAETSVKEQLKVFVMYLDAIADLLTSIARIEKEYPHIPSIFSQQTKSFWVEFGSNLPKSLNEKEFISLMKLIYRTSRPDLWSLPPEKKIDLSEELKSFSKEILEIIGEK